MSSPPVRIAVVIVNYNSGGLVRAAVDSLKNQTVPPYEVIIVDNASPDHSADEIDFGDLPRARVIKLDTNTGYARASNLAAREAEADWIATLNPDAFAQADWLENLSSAVRTHPEVASFASLQIDAADKTRLDGTGDAYFFLGIPWRGGFGRKVEETPGIGECFSACGAGALYDRKRLLELGGFDEDFFCYCEDVDLGFRLRLAGERCVFLPGAVVFHHGSAITGRRSDFTVKLGTRNRLTTYLKNMPPVALLLTLPGHVLATLYLYLRAVGQPHAKAMRQGFFEALRRVPSTLTARRESQRQRQLNSFELFRMMCWNPAVLHQRRAHVWPLLRQSAVPSLSETKHTPV